MILLSKKGNLKWFGKTKGNLSHTDNSDHVVLLALSEEFELGQRDGGEEVLAHAESVQDDLVELGASSTSEESVELKKGEF